MGHGDWRGATRPTAEKQKESGNANGRGARERSLGGDPLLVSIIMLTNPTRHSIHPHAAHPPTQDSKSAYTADERAHAAQPQRLHTTYKLTRPIVSGKRQHTS